MTMSFHRWVCRPRILVSVVVLCLAYYAVFMGGVPKQWRERFARKGQAIDESLKAVLNETLGFQKLLVINMPERTDRRDAISLAAAVSKMNVEFVMGVRGDSIVEDSFPPGGSTESIKLSNGIKGSWRSHMNALQQVVYQNLSTALIFEDDVDWDIRIRPQLQAFALASRWLSDDPETSKHISSYSISVTPNPEREETSIHNSSSLNPFASELFSVSLPSVMKDVQHRDARISPYGDPENWDILWLGHCGAGFPRSPDGLPEPIGRHNVLLQDPNDPTVPMPPYLRAHPFGPLDALGETHPPHTRVYHRASGGALCTVAYAVSQRGARRLLHEFSVKKWSRIWDVEMGDWCAGDDFTQDIEVQELLTPETPEEEYDGVFEGENEEPNEEKENGKAALSDEDIKKFEDVLEAYKKMQDDDPPPAHDGPPKGGHEKTADEDLPSAPPKHSHSQILDLEEDPAAAHDNTAKHPHSQTADKDAQSRPAHDGPPSHLRPQIHGEDQLSDRSIKSRSRSRSFQRRDRITDQKSKRGQRKCITSQPPIFAHHHPLGGESNIGGLGGGYARDVETKYVRLSTRLNLEALVRGDPDETLVDQWPDY